MCWQLNFSRTQHLLAICDLFQFLCRLEMHLIFRKLKQHRYLFSLRRISKRYSRWKIRLQMVLHETTLRTSLTYFPLFAKNGSFWSDTCTDFEKLYRIASIFLKIVILLVVHGLPSQFEVTKSQYLYRGMNVDFNFTELKDYVLHGWECAFKISIKL